MRSMQRALAGVCLILGLPVVMLALLEISHPNTSPQDRSEASAALFLLGIPPTALGGWLVWNLRCRRQQAFQAVINQRERLFLELLQASQGQLTILQFAAAAEMPVEEAKGFLDHKAKVLDATFDVSDAGAVVYQFPM